MKSAPSILSPICIAALAALVPALAAGTALAEDTVVTVTGSGDVYAPIDWQGGSYWPKGPLVCADTAFTYTMTADWSGWNWSYSGYSIFRDVADTSRTLFPTLNHHISFDDPACPTMDWTTTSFHLFVSGEDGGLDYYGAPGHSMFSVMTGDGKPMISVTSDDSIGQDMTDGVFNGFSGPFETYAQGGYPRALNGWTMRTAGNIGTVTVGDPDPCAALGGDTDSDGVCDANDNCPSDANEDQADADGDLIGDVCEADTDGDGTIDDFDNCPADPNPLQGDSDGDLQGDVCDLDDDNDGAADDADNCPLIPNADQVDFDGDGDGDACDGDDDADGVADEDDLCPNTPTDVPFDGDGCSGIQLVERAAPCDGDWANHGQYQSAVVAAANAARNAGLLTGKERAAIVRTAAKSSCGN